MTVTGDKEVIRRLEALPGKLQKQALRKATRDNAKIVAAEARQRAPVDTGDLENSIKVRAIRRSRVKIGHGIHAGSNSLAGEGLPFYAVMVEYGTKLRFHRSGKSVGAAEGDPFMRPALYNNKERIRRNTIRVIKDWLRTLKP